MNSSSTTVVLGWDGLDYRIVEEFGLEGEFAPHSKEIDTFDNEVTEYPGTYELWPSIFTGVMPETHGVYLLRYNGEGDANVFSGRIAGKISELFDSAISDEKSKYIAMGLRNRGYNKTQKTPEWYREKGVTTLFDGVHARPVGVPNYRTALDERLDLMSGWCEEMAEVMKFTTHEEKDLEVYKPRIPIDDLESWQIAKAQEKLGVVKRSVHSGEYDLVFVWLSYLDTVGHTMFYADPEYQRRNYRHAATMTRELREWLSDEDELVVVSDHGNRDGLHTHNAYFGATDEDALTGVSSVLDVRGAVEKTISRGSRTDAGVERERANSN
ncbi:MAG: alkaline phosphatase family protein [Halobacteria archaeon]